MNFQQIRFFQAITETGSFTKAAERCFVTQPTLSNAISQLEDELGGEIFQRKTKPITLTEFGQHLLDDMRDILLVRERLLSRAADFVARDEGSVRLGISPLVSDDYVSTLMQRLQSADQDLNILISQMNKADIEPALQNGIIDFGIGPSPMQSTKTLSTPIYSEPLLYLCGDSVASNSFALRDINGKTLLFVQPAVRTG